MNTYEMLEEAAHRAYTRGIQTGTAAISPHEGTSA